MNRTNIEIMALQKNEKMNRGSLKLFQDNLLKNTGHYY